ncbi:MAG: hypothetical protein MMC33_006411 [Icmadophila ericetorum]|nr:hypothetical protein [Icmadophila ericetorum]
MGEGGYLCLVNGTAYTWRKDQGKSGTPYQMTAFNFQDIIAPGAVETVYLEFEQELFTKRGDTAGHCVYSLEGTSHQIHCKVTDSPERIQVQLQGFGTPNNPNGSWINIGWAHNGIVRFILSGKEGMFASSNPPSDWMRNNLKTLGPRLLSQITMVGTHDAGMSKITHTEDVPSPILTNFVITQSQSIGGQLQDGSRYFDIRPIIGGGAFSTGHYTGRIGARGERLQDIINDINAYTASHKELIILNLSHDSNTDTTYNGFSQDEWNLCFTQLEGIRDRIILNGDEANDLSKLPLNRFLGSGSAAIVIVLEAGSQIQLGKWHNQGFFYQRQLNVRNEYSNTPELPKMSSDQLDKLDHLSPTDPRLFLLSWTLTQPSPPSDISVSNIADPSTIKGLETFLMELRPIKTMADEANQALFSDLYPHCKPHVAPNVVYIDNLVGKDFAALAMAINDKCYTNA